MDMLLSVVLHLILGFIVRDSSKNPALSQSTRFSHCLLGAGWLCLAVSMAGSSFSKYFYFGSVLMLPTVFWLFAGLLLLVLASLSEDRAAQSSSRIFRGIGSRREH